MMSEEPQRRAVIRPSWKAVLLMIPITLEMAGAQANLTANMLQHCGMRFRIATHISPPFTIIKRDLCTEQYCPPAAFEPDGGLTYSFFQFDVLPKLKKMCKDAGQDDRVEFDWFIPNSDIANGETPVNMVCNQGFTGAEGKRLVSQTNPFCKDTYKGASKIDSTCKGAYGANANTCNSAGPDMAVGSIHVTRERMDMLQFSIPFYYVHQVLIKAPDNFIMISLRSIMTILQPFTLELWIVILIEIVAVTICILLTEAGVEHFRQMIFSEDLEEVHELKNPHLQPGWGVIYDSWFWSCGSAFDPGGPGKAPASIGGKVLMVGHWMFAVIIAASYTGTVGPYIESTKIDTIDSINALYPGTKSIVVRGPLFNSAKKDNQYLGTSAGSNSLPDTPASIQFNYLQSIMSSDKTAAFKIVTTKRMESRYKDDITVLTYDKNINPCQVSGAQLGAFDLVMCGSEEADTLIFDAPGAYYEINQRYNKTNECKLVVVSGSQFSPTGYALGLPKMSPYVDAINVAIQELRQAGIVDGYKKKYQLRESDLKCASGTDSLSGLVMTLPLLAGLFVITTVFILASFVHGIFERLLFKAKTLEERRLAQSAAEKTPPGSEAGDEAKKHYSGDEDPGEKMMYQIDEMHDGFDRIEGLVASLVERKKLAVSSASVIGGFNHALANADLVYSNEGTESTVNQPNANSKMSMA